MSLANIKSYETRRPETSVSTNVSWRRLQSSGWKRLNWFMMMNISTASTQQEKTSHHLCCDGPVGGARSRCSAMIVIQSISNHHLTLSNQSLLFNTSDGTAHQETNRSFSLNVSEVSRCQTQKLHEGVKPFEGHWMEGKVKEWRRRVELQQRQMDWRRWTRLWLTQTEIKRWVGVLAVSPSWTKCHGVRVRRLFGSVRSHRLILRHLYKVYVWMKVLKCSASDAQT